MKKTTNSKSRTVSRTGSGPEARKPGVARAAGQKAQAEAQAGRRKKAGKAVAPAAPRPVVTPVAPATISGTPVKATVRAGKKSAAPAPARAAAKPAAAAVTAGASSAPVKLPAILFEGDFPTPATATTTAAAAVTPTGPGHRFELGPLTSPPLAPPPPPAPERVAELPELPESYGTGRLLLTPRDPFWLYAHWDFSFEHLRRFNSRAVDGHLVLRVYQHAVTGAPVTEIPLHPESREWFVNVPLADMAYVADLGFFGAPGRWQSVAQSSVVRTPAATMSADLTVQFATVPVEAALQQVIEAVQESVAPTPSAAPASAPASAPAAVLPAPPLTGPVEAARAERSAPVIELRPEGAVAPAASLARPASPTATAPTMVRQAAWTPAQERAFAAVIRLVEEVRRTWGGSEELAALIRQQLCVTPVPALVPPGQPDAHPPLEAPSSASLAAPASPDAAPAKRGFWFNVNAELVIYGATEPGAEVTIGGRVIKLRTDGTFGYRFALPDGEFALPVVAVAADGTEGRAADLRFTRQTEYRGEVAAQPQDPALKPPTGENVG